MTVRPFKDGKYYMIDFRYDTLDGRKRCREVCEQPGKRAAQDFEVRRRRELEAEDAAKREEVAKAEALAQEQTPTPQTPTVASWAAQWLEERKASAAEGLISGWKTDNSRLTCHILPGLGPLHLDEVKPRHLIALVKSLRVAKLAPRTIRSVYGLVQAMFRDAVIAEEIAASPCVLRERELGPVVDKDPEWRAKAVFTLDELETLISDGRIPVDRRVLNALAGVAGLRHGEIAGLRWRHYDPDAKPLGKLAIVTSYDRGRTKTSKPRDIKRDLDI